MKKNILILFILGMAATITIDTLDQTDPNRNLATFTGVQISAPIASNPNVNQNSPSVTQTVNSLQNGIENMNQNLHDAIRRNILSPKLGAKSVGNSQKIINVPQLSLINQKSNTNLLSNFGQQINNIALDDVQAQTQTQPRP
jgi:hypothetical protein